MTVTEGKKHGKDRFRCTMIDMSVVCSVVKKMTVFTTKNNIINQYNGENEVKSFEKSLSEKNGFLESLENLRLSVDSVDSVVMVDRATS